MMKVGLYLGNKQQTWLEQFRLVAKSWGKERGLKVEVKGLEFSSVEALEAEKYDLVLHKMVEHIALEDSNEDLARELHLLEEYFERQPHVAFEPMRSVRVVMNRLEVAERLKGISVDTLEGRVSQPPFHAAFTLDEARALADSVKFELPWVVKPHVADGVPESHNLGMILNMRGLEEAPLPFIIQPFVNHGGLIIKVYVLGDIILQLNRPSLPNVPQRGAKDDEPGYVPFGRVSNARESPKVVVGEDVRVPEELLRKAVGEVSSRLQLKLFGIDLIRDDDTGAFLIIDVNYLPGYYGVPNVFESMLDLFQSTITERSQ